MSDELQPWPRTTTDRHDRDWFANPPQGVSPGYIEDMPSVASALALLDGEKGGGEA